MNAMIYDRFQKEAINHINAGHSVVVSAPTGAGKTAIAEHVITTSIEKNLGVIYTAPIKALSNQKFRDLQRMYGDHIGILTGDVSINPEAAVMIMTTEILRNKILDEPERLSRYSWVIFDEIHYLDNHERGTVWEESLMLLPEHMNILGLSATIPNIKAFASWIEAVHKKPVRIVIEEKRPVPLHFLFYCANTVTSKLEHVRKLKVPKQERIYNLINYLRDKEGLPAIYFVFGRRRAEDLALAVSGFSFLGQSERRTIEEMFASLCERFDLKNEPSAQRLYPLIQRGIAYHHAGMLPTLKEVIERLFTSKLIKIIFTTETFALGINMPSRSVIFDELMKFYGRFMRYLKTRDFYQMAGRAGRRGIDTEGFVYCRINPRRVDLREIHRVIYSQPEEVRSQFNTSYATILNLYQRFKENLVDIYPRSFHYYQSHKSEQKKAVALMRAKLDLLKQFGCIDNGELTEKGKFAKAVYGYELILSELYEENILEQLDEFGLGIMAAAIVFEPRKNQLLPHSLSKGARSLRHACERIHADIKDQERSLRVWPASKMPYFHLSAAMEAWLRGTDFNKTLSYTDTDEGELVRYFRMSVQILREIADAPISSYVLKDKVRETIRVINRDVVDAEKQLRESE